MNKNVVLIFSGHNNRAVVSFCRFCSENNISFFIVSASKDDIIYFTDYKQNIIATRKSNELKTESFYSYKKKIRERNNLGKILILPSTEFLNRFLLENRKELEDDQFIVPLVNINLYEQISDKLSFSHLCKKKKIKIPKEFDDISNITIPFVAKPKKYKIDGDITVEKPILIMNDNDLKLFISKKNKDNFYFQEFIGGSSFYLLYYFNKDGSYSVYSQNNLIQQDNGLSIIGAKSSNFHHNKVSNDYASLLQGKGFEGLIMIEVKMFKNEIFMIEANPRLWGPSQLILDANMDLFYHFATDFNLISGDLIFNLDYKENITYFWSGGIHEDLSKNNLLAFHCYDQAIFLKEYNNWVINDVYLKNDSISLYFHELKKK